MYSDHTSGTRVSVSAGARWDSGAHDQPLARRRASFVARAARRAVREEATREAADLTGGARDGARRSRRVAQLHVRPTPPQGTHRAPRARSTWDDFCLVRTTAGSHIALRTSHFMLRLVDDLRGLGFGGSLVLGGGGVMAHLRALGEEQVGACIAPFADDRTLQSPAAKCTHSKQESKRASRTARRGRSGRRLPRSPGAARASPGLR